MAYWGKVNRVRWFSNLTWQQPSECILVGAHHISSVQSRGIHHPASPANWAEHQEDKRANDYQEGKLQKNPLGCLTLSSRRLRVKALGEDWTVISSNPTGFLNNLIKRVILVEESMNSVNWFASTNWWEKEMAGNVGQAAPSCYNYAFVCILVMDKIFVTLSIHYVHCICLQESKDKHFSLLLLLS